MAEEQQPPADGEVERRHINSEPQPDRVQQEQVKVTNKVVIQKSNAIGVKPGRHKRRGGK